MPEIELSKATDKEIAERVEKTKQLSGNIRAAEHQIESMKTLRYDQLRIVNFIVRDAGLLAKLDGTLEKQIRIPNLIDPNTGDIILNIENGVVSWNNPEEANEDNANI